MKKEYRIQTLESDNVYVVKTTYLGGTQLDGFASKQSALDFADQQLKTGIIQSVEVTHVIKLVREV
jgi:hypothetical protein